MQVVQRACVGFLWLEIFKSAKDTALGSLLELSLCWAGGLDHLISRGTFKPHPYCDFIPMVCPVGACSNPQLPASGQAVEEQPLPHQLTWAGGTAHRNTPPRWAPHCTSCAAPISGQEFHSARAVTLWITPEQALKNTSEHSLILGWSKIA